MITVLGGTGFVGSVVLARARVLGLQARAAAAPRLATDASTPRAVVTDARRRLAVSGSPLDDLHDVVATSDVVVNCAGRAEPGAPWSPGLAGANALLPTVVARLCRREGTTLVHVSSAAVQGPRPILDEGPAEGGRTPYARTKALGEHGLAEVAGQRTRIYRATSVQGVGRGVSDRLRSLLGAPIVPVVGAGDQALPLALLDNTAAGILHTARHLPGDLVVLHPWEGVTVRRLVSLVEADTRVVSVPTPPARLALALLERLGELHAPLGAVANRAAPLVRGQRPVARTLEHAGFVLPVGFEGYRALATGAGQPGRTSRTGGHPGSTRR